MLTDSDNIALLQPTKTAQGCIKQCQSQMVKAKANRMYVNPNVIACAQSHMFKDIAKVPSTLPKDQHFMTIPNSNGRALSNTVKDEAKVKWSKPRPLKKQWPRGYNQSEMVKGVVQANRAVMQPNSDAMAKCAVKPALSSSKDTMMQRSQR